jgi:hypothetical protein
MAEMRRNRGQALIEYMPVLTVVSAIAILALWPLGCGTGNVFVDLLTVFSGGPEDLAICPAPEVKDGDRTPCVEVGSYPGASDCSQSEFCEELEGENSGFYIHQSGDIQVLVIKTAEEYRSYTPGHTQDGCYSVIIEGNTASWRTIGSEDECQDVSHLQSWQLSFCAE